ncbi:ABC transporter substrate-binding protein [Streptomyces gilvigriseus]|uniref:ABC transporter substrate-binding protein n=1 Tax=Mangrovactinospora gilvigrisea TaxID=1428644 RepID=UPI0008FC4692
MRWPLVAALLLLLTCVASASPAAPGRVPATGSSTGPITLVTAQDLTGYLQNRLAVWNRAHPAEKVTLIELPAAADDTQAQMISNLQARSDRYDVLNLDVDWTAQFAAAGWITPLPRQRFPLSSFLPPTVDAATYRGRLYAVPYVANAGMLFYRKDILAKAHVRPPRTWAELEDAAKTIAPRFGLKGYASQLSPYEGLTVNYAEAVQSAGGQILGRDGRTVAVDSPAARSGLSFLVDGVRQGWIPKASLGFDEEKSRQAFQSGQYLFLRNWPYVYDLAQAKGSPVAGKVGVVPLPGATGPGSSSLGGSDLAVSSYSRHPRTAERLIQFMTGVASQRQVLLAGSLPPARADLYRDPALVARFPYLPALRQSILSARPRPKNPRYDQVSLAVAQNVYDALIGRRSPDGAAGRLAADLSAIVHGS